MSTSEAPEACSVCGEVLDPTRIDSGCVACNPVKWNSALKPEIPVSTGPADRADGIGCLQHGLVGCERCALLETRHRLAFDPHQQDEATGSWVRDERGAGLGVAILFAGLMVLIGLCGWYVWTHYPR